MLSAEAIIIISGLAGVVATLAGIVHHRDTSTIKSQSREIRYLTAMIISQGAKKDEMMAEYKRFLEAREMSSGE